MTTSWSPSTVLEGALPAEVDLPPVDGLSTRGFATLVDRGISLLVLAALVPTVATGVQQGHHLHWLWLAIFGGGIAAVSLLMPVYAWARRGIRTLAMVYAGFVIGGVITRPLAWSGDAADGGSLLWTQLGLATLCVALAVSSRAGIAYGLVGIVAFTIGRTLPAGGSASVLLALQDAVVVLVQPMVVLLVVNYLRDQVVRLDADLAARHAETMDAAVNDALVAERHRLDAIVHDEIMTTLVAGSKSGAYPEPHVAQQARAALEWLRQEGADDGDEDAGVSADRLVRLVKDVTASVCPRAQVLGEIPAAAVRIPQPVVRVLMQACREAALNCEKHSRAENVQVLVGVATTARKVNVRISISDDGAGFDPAAVSPKRLGLRVAVGERMETVGGRVETISAPGRGTTVRLHWSGDRPQVVAARGRTQRDPSQHPLFKITDPRPIIGAGIGLALVYVTMGAGTMAQLRRPDLVSLAIVLMITGLALGLAGLVRPPIGSGQGWLQVAMAIAGTDLALVALDIGGPRVPWPPHATSFTALVMLVLLVTFAAGQARPAWAGAVAHGITMLLNGTNHLRFGDLAIGAATPLLVLGASYVFFFFMDALWDQLEEADREVQQSAQVNANLFGKLVLREVWLAELRAEVGPPLEQIADVGRPVTDADRETYLLMESGLRDGIMAANFNAPSLGAAIMAARGRGVSVTLVDNRGARLPEDARRVTISTLEGIVASAVSGRIVARTAPEGYDEAVTILHVATDGDVKLTKIDEAGRVEVGRPVPAEETHEGRA